MWAQAVDAPCREKGSAALGGTRPALMESSALMMNQNFSKGVGNARPWVYQTFTELGKLLWKNLIQSDWAPAALSGLPDPHPVP